MTWPSDDEIVADIVQQTAEFRYRHCWSGGRRLLAARGIDPMRCVLTSCDQGDDVAGTLILPDGAIVEFDMKQDPQTRDLTSIARWETIPAHSHHDELACRITTGGDTEIFNQRVQEYIDEALWQRNTRSMPSSREHPMTETWEYKIVFVDAQRWTTTGLPNELNQDFDSWGAQGWELVATEAIVRQRFLGYGNTTLGVLGFFKRRIKRPKAP